METLKKWRMRQLLTQQEVAEKVGISKRQYLRIENGKSSPNLKTAYLISKLFQCSIEEAFSDCFSSGGERETEWKK